MTTPRARLVSGLVLAGAAAVGCGADFPLKSGSASSGGTMYWQDVAPIYNAKCVRCHQEGGVAPFRLDRYADAKVHADAAIAAVTAGTMPPYAMVHDGSCGDFHDERALSPAEKTLIARWVSDGAAEGTPVTLPAPDIPTLDGAVEVTTPLFSPAAQGSLLAPSDEYRCFPMSPPAGAGPFLTGYDVTPGDAAIVHHVIAFVVDPAAPGIGGQTNAAIMQALDADSPDRLGWPCLGDAGPGVVARASPIAWAPGQGVVAYPPGMGVPIHATDMLVVQVHYNLADVDAAAPPRTDQTTIRLRFAPTVERQVVFVMMDPFLDSLRAEAPDWLPPLQADTAYTRARRGRDLGIGVAGAGVPTADLVAVMPHMHSRGVRQLLHIGASDGADDDLGCAAHLEGWSFHWQQVYFYRTPIPISADSTVQLTCEYDTSKDFLPVLPGWGTRNEMCLSVMMLALPGGS